jgi:plasmid stabilization system protein ParE
MLFDINLTQRAINDVENGVEYYNALSENLGFRFADEIDFALQQIAKMPTAYSFRYKNVRAKQVNKFPFLIYFIIDDSKTSVEVLRIFNTYQNPFW